MDRRYVDAAIEDYATGVADERAALLHATISSLEEEVAAQAAEIARLQALLDAEEPDPGMWIGADVNVPGGTPADNTLPNFLAANKLFDGKLTYRRIFPALGSAGVALSVRANWDSGVRTIGSFAAPGGDYAGLASGKYDAQVATWARSISDVPDVWWTAIHEPEPKLPAEQFQAIHARLYPIVKTENPDITWGPFYMSYWWLPSRLASIGGASAWLIPDEFCDVRTADQYAVQPGPLETDPEFRGWYDAIPTTKPLALTEYGVYVVPPGQQPDPAKLARRAEVIAQDMAWLTDTGRFALISYWHGKGSKGDWSLQDSGSQTAYRTAAAQGRVA